MLVAASLILELDLSSWMMWTAEGMRQTLLIVITMDLETITVVIVKMQEWFVSCRVCDNLEEAANFL